jgi:hypothetical protein
MHLVFWNRLCSTVRQRLPYFSATRLSSGFTNKGILQRKQTKKLKNNSQFSTNLGRNSADIASYSLYFIKTCFDES